MPRPLLSVTGKRQPRALVVGLRRVVKDPRATVAQRLRACELLATIEGYISGRIQEQPSPKNNAAEKIENAPFRPITNPKNATKLRYLLEMSNAPRQREGHLVNSEVISPLTGKVDTSIGD
jgi:hypothetical protein